MPRSNDKPAVGWIGLGDQGTPMAQAIADNGYQLHVWARHPESLKALDGHAFIPHSSVAEMAAVSDVVGLCLREDSGNVQVVTDEGCWRRSAGAAVRFGFQLRAAGHRPVDHR